MQNNIQSIRFNSFVLWLILSYAKWTAIIYIFIASLWECPFLDTAWFVLVKVKLNETLYIVILPDFST